MVKQVVNPTYTPVPHPAESFRTFNEFYPFYLGEHSRRLNRILHLLGTSIAVTCHTRILLSLAPYLVRLLRLRVGPEVERLVRGLELSRAGAGKLLLGAVVQGYAWAWVGHLVERNKPATFKYPLFSLRGDFRMLWEVVSMQRAV